MEPVDFKSLCPYFWWTVLTVALSILIFPVRVLAPWVYNRFNHVQVNGAVLFGYTILCGAAAFMLSIIFLVHSAFTIVGVVPPFGPDLLLLWGGMNIAILGCLSGIVMEEKEELVAKEAPYSSLVVEYLKAVKAKVCPRIEWV